MPILSNSRWRCVVTDLNGDATQGGGVVINAESLQHNYFINAGKTTQFSLAIDNPLANYVLSHDTLLKVYRRTRITKQWQLMMVGDIIHAEEDGQGDVGYITVVAADPWWRLQKRLLGTAIDSYGRGMGITFGSATSQIDLGSILQSALQRVNSTLFTGINVGTNTPSSNGYLGPLYMQPLGDLFQQICTALAGPDFWLVPREPTGAMPNTAIAIMNTGMLGQTQPNCVFEYGMGQRNVQTYTRILSKDGLANEIFSPQQGFPSLPAGNDAFVKVDDPTSQNAIGLFQDMVQSDVGTAVLRTQLANEYLSVRKYARQQITFTPAVDCNLDYGVDYSVGDVVGARAMVNHNLRFNGTVRVYGANFSLDDKDAESVSLTLIPGG